jgi:signal transduction histidine kinase
MTAPISRSGPNSNSPTRAYCCRGPRRSRRQSPPTPPLSRSARGWRPIWSRPRTSLADLQEVGEALQGRFSAVLRARVSKHDAPPLYSTSRGTGVRVFTAMPVIVRGQVAGVVYASRTPSNVFKYLYEQRGKVILAVLFMAIPTLLIGFVFHRTITEPMRELVERTRSVGKGERDALRPLRRHGTSEFARLSQSFLDMARRLNTRSSFISTFATHVSHELKSPLTSIQGAAELLRDDLDSATPAMTDAEKRKFLDNIISDTERLAKISGRLRDFARAENPIALGAAKLSTAIAGLRAKFPSLDIEASGELDTPMRISDENAGIIFSNLADATAAPGSMSRPSGSQACCGSRSPTMAKASRRTTAPRSSTASSPRDARAAAPAWALPSCEPCSMPMAARSASWTAITARRSN